MFKWCWKGPIGLVAVGAALASGCERAEKVLPTVLWNIDRVVDGFSADKLEMLMDLLNRMKANVQRGEDATNVA